jgi:hypothetical protein
MLGLRDPNLSVRFTIAQQYTCYIVDTYKTHKTHIICRVVCWRKLFKGLATKIDYFTSTRAFVYMF